jgi:hypothetical protein
MCSTDAVGSAPTAVRLRPSARRTRRSTPATDRRRYANLDAERCACAAGVASHRRRRASLASVPRCGCGRAARRPRARADTASARNPFRGDAVPAWVRAKPPAGPTRKADNARTTPSAPTPRRDSTPLRRRAVPSVPDRSTFALVKQAAATSRTPLLIPIASCLRAGAHSNHWIGSIAARVWLFYTQFAKRTEGAPVARD